MTAPVCAHEKCARPATTEVKWLLGREWFCADHAAWVRMVESEWDQAEADYLEQR